MDTLFVTVLFGLLFGGLDANKDHVHDQDLSDVPSNVYRSPVVEGFSYLAEHFDDPEYFKRQWILSEAKKDDIDDEIAKYDGLSCFLTPRNRFYGSNDDTTSFQESGAWKRQQRTTKKATWDWC